MPPDQASGASADLSDYAGPQTTPDAAVAAVRDWLARSLPPGGRLPSAAARPRSGLSARRRSIARGTRSTPARGW